MERGIRHWRNSKEAGECLFVTTTCLNFARLLERPEMRDRLARIIASDCRYYGAILHSFAIMPHHLHMLLRAPETNDMSWFMQRFKSNSAKELGPLLTALEIDQMGDEYGLAGRKFWKISFRGIPIRDERMFWSVCRYIHFNPVREGLVPHTVDYRWSSAQMFESCLWHDEHGINTAMEQMWLSGDSPTPQHDAC